MVWGVDAVKKLASGELNTSAPALLGFNEPDNAGQSNILPAVAASLWPQLEATGMRLGSPAVSVGHQWWLEQFFGNCTGCRVDFITVHWYAEWGGGCSPNAFIKYVNRFTKYGKPLWVTEFSCTLAWSAADNLSFLKGLLPTLTATVPLLERYAWFTTRSQEANWSNVTLVDSNGTFTELGEYFSQQ